MQERGTRPKGVEVGNASKLQMPGAPTNWIVGQTEQIARDSLRFMRQPAEMDEGDLSKGVSIKFFTHRPSDPAKWGRRKPESRGRTFSILVGSGAFEISIGVEGEEYVVVLDEPGDFIIWGAGLRHSWRPLTEATILTVRWVPVEQSPREGAG